MSAVGTSLQQNNNILFILGVSSSIPYVSLWTDDLGNQGMLISAGDILQIKANSTVSSGAVLNCFAQIRQFYMLLRLRIYGASKLPTSVIMWCFAWMFVHMAKLDKGE